MPRVELSFEDLVTLMENGARLNASADHAVGWLRDLLKDQDSATILAMFIDARDRLQNKED